MTAPPTTAELLDALFRARLRPDGTEYSYLEVARTIKAQSGRSIDPSYIGRIRSGDVKNPGREALMLLCRFFEVPSAYFFPELSQDYQMPTVSMDPVAGVGALLRRSGVSQRVTSDLENLIRTLQRSGSDITSEEEHP